MVSTARRRFITRVTLGYAVFALAWIFLSDQLLAQFTDLSHIVWFSSAKGLSFVVVTAALLFFALRAVPAVELQRGTEAEYARQRGLLGWPRWLCHTLAVLASLAFLLIQSGVGQAFLPIVLMLPIILSAAIGGFAPGFVATVVCALGARVDLETAFGFAGFSSSRELFQWCFLVLNGVLVSVLCEVLQRAWRSLEGSGQLRLAILGGVADAILATDAAGRVSYLNPAAERLTGWTQTEALGLPLERVFALLDDRDALPVTDLQRQILASDEAYSAAAWLVDRVGTHVPVHLRGTAVRLEDEVCIGQVLVVRDESEHRRMASNLRQANELLQEMSALAQVGGWELDPVTRTGTWTRELAAIHEVEPEGTTTAAFSLAFYQGRWRVIVESAVERLIREGTPFDIEVELTTARGRQKWVRSVAVPVYVDGVLVKLRGALQDISARKRAEDALRMSEARYARVIEGSDQGFWELNVQTQQFDVSPRFATMLGYGPVDWDITRPRWGDYVHPDDLKQSLASIEAHLAGKLPLHQAELRMRAASGDWKWVLTRGRIVQWDAEGKPLIMSGTHTDISERKRAEAALRLSAAVFENTQEGVVVTDGARMIVAANKAFVRLTGFEADAVQGKEVGFLWPGALDGASLSQAWAEVARQGYWQGEIWGCRKNGESFPELLSISCVRDGAGDVIHYVMVFTDLSSLRASEERLDYLSHHDPLTQLPNRVLLFSRVDHALATARRDGGLVALLMFDLDRFKDINDSFGHLLGDQLLLRVAERLSERLRAADFFARLGGDEFTVLLEHLARPEDAARVAGEIMAALAQPFALTNGAEIQCSASIGISLYPGHGDTAESLLQQADTAMYRAKAEGRGHFQYFSESMTEAARNRIGLDTRLRRAIGQNELRVYYQPLVDIGSNRIVGAEALVRWQDPEEGLIPPIRFIPIAEETGLIREIGSWVLRETCRQGRAWLDAGLAPLVLAVNVSAHQIRHGQLGGVIDEVLAETGFPANLLELELTESTLMAEHEEIPDLLDRLRQRQIRLAIDDFGTGYSSLAYLKRFPLDILKIDKSFIADIAQNRDDREITLAIISMAHSLGFKVLAEGVESAEQLAFLQSHGCDMYQGYFRSKPVPAAEFERLLRELPGTA